MFRISCFADEISSDLDVQIEVMKRNKVRYVELRSVWNKNVLDLDDRELDRVKEEFLSNGIRVSSIGSPIGKVDIGNNFKDYLEIFKRAVEAALKMETRFIRIFSFYIKKDELDFYEETVIDRLRQMLEISRKNKLVLLHENEADIFGESSERCRKLFDRLGGSDFRAVFDPSNFIVAGEDAFDESFSKLKEYVEYIHVKDSIKGTGEIVVAGQGDGKIKEIFEELRDREGMFVSLEPHLAHAGKYRGFTGPELFEKDLGALKEILQQLGIGYE